MDPQAAQATATTVRDMATCGGINGTWDSGICTLKESYVVRSGNSLAIAFGVTLLISGGSRGIASWIENNGTLTNDGNITIANSDESGIINMGSFVNSAGGSITVPSTELHYGIRNGGDFINRGDVTISNSGGDGVVNFVTARRIGVFTNDVGGTITITNTGSSVGIYNDHGTFVNDGIITLSNSGTAGIANYGGALNNIGTIYLCGGNMNPADPLSGNHASKCVDTVTQTCDSSMVLVGTITDCAAYVRYGTPTGTVFWEQTGPGAIAFFPDACTLSSGTCKVGVKGMKAGSVTLNANYSGDSIYPSKSAAANITVNTVAIACIGSSSVVGTSRVCKATIIAPRPSGAIVWSSNRPGRFSAQTCRLAKGTCSVRYTPLSGVSPVTITANYPGDKSNSASFGTSSLTITPKASRAFVSCNLHGSLPRGHRSTCTVTVSGYRPTGVVNWSQNGAGSVQFSSPTCFLKGSPQATVRASCSVAIVGVSSGVVSINAAYGGDVSNTASSRSVMRSVSTSGVYTVSTSASVSTSTSVSASTSVLQSSTSTSSAQSTAFPTTVSSTTTTASSSWGPLGTFHVNVAYVADVSSTTCSLYIWECSWSGTIWSPDSGLSYVLGPTAGGASWPFQIWGCDEWLDWSLTVSVKSTLTVSVVAPDGQIVSVQTATMTPYDQLNGSYLTCSQTTTATVVFPTITSTTTRTYTIYQNFTVIGSLRNLPTGNESKCSPSPCGYTFQWDVILKGGGCLTLCINGADNGNYTIAQSLSCLDEMTWSFTKDTAETQLTFELTRPDGGVILFQSTAGSGSPTIQGSWSPSCVSTTTTTTQTYTYFAPAPISAGASAVGGLVVSVTMIAGLLGSRSRHSGRSSVGK